MQILCRKQKTTTKRERCGAALVEMALVLPIFVSVTLGIVEFGRAMMVGQMITNASREGVRLGILDGSSNSQITSFIDDFLSESINVDAGSISTTITLTPAPGNNTSGNEVANAQPKDLVTVRIEVPFNDVSFLSPKFMKDKTLSSQAAMRHE